ncbi:MAG: GNAT family N-acetyltransferase [Clostridia bacterium]
MVTVELMDWEHARPLAAPVRFAVFVEEQRVPAEIELDDMDARSLHALAFHGKEVIGTGRLLPDGHVGRMAVLKAWRHRGIGGMLLTSLMQKAKQEGHGEVLLSAQVHAIPFYERHGFRCEGPEFDDAGIPHRTMRRAL